MTRSSRIAGRAVGALVVLAALPGLAACSPKDKPLTAVRAVDGRPVVLLAGCTDFTIDRIVVYRESGNATVAADTPGRTMEGTGAATPESLPLFGDAPAGWKVTDGRLTELAPGQEYGLSAYASGRRVVPITFTADDLAGLGADEVLVGKTPSSHEKVTEKEFRERAKDSC